MYKFITKSLGQERHRVINRFSTTNFSTRLPERKSKCRQFSTTFQPCLEVSKIASRLHQNQTIHIATTRYYSSRLSKQNTKKTQLDSTRSYNVPNLEYQDNENSEHLNELLPKREPSSSDSHVPYRALKPITPNDLYVSCTTFDKKGNIIGVSQKYPKMKFLKDNFLFPRDLRKIDTSSIDVIPSIMVRSPNSILVNLLHIKAIVKKDSVMIFDTSTPSIATKLGIFMYDLELKLKLPSDIPYEFKALESILISVMSYLESELNHHRKTCGLILTELEDQIDRSKLQDLLIRSKALSSFYQKSILIKGVLEELLDNDEDLEAMYLSPHSTTEIDSYQEIEMILESYYNQCDEIVQQAGSLLNDIKVTEEIINIILDTNRNSLMLFELKLTVYTLGFTVATLVPAFYGMNLKNYIEDSNLGFGAVVIISILQGLLITKLNFRKLKVVQKLTMGDGLSRNANTKVFGNYGSQIEFHNKSIRNKWYYKMMYGTRNTKYHHPSKKDKDAIWQMINDDKRTK